MSKIIIDGINVSVSICNKALMLILSLDNSLVLISDIDFNPHGTISIRFENEKSELFLEIGENNYSYYIKHIDRDPIFIDGDNDIINDLDKIITDIKKLEEIDF
jgi:hypothetical protein